MDISIYTLIKMLHIGTAILSISGFTYRGIIKIISPDKTLPRWLKVFPHINDTLLLSCAIYLASMSNQWPTTADWVAAKVIALLFYIGLGMIVLRYAKTRDQRIIAFALAIMSFGYILATAFTRNPMLAA